MSIILIERVDSIKTALKKLITRTLLLETLKCAKNTMRLNMKKVGKVHHLVKAGKDTLTVKKTRKIGRVSHLVAKITIKNGHLKSKVHGKSISSNMLKRRKQKQQT